MPRRDDTFIIYYAEDFEQYETSNPSNLYCISESSIDIILSALRFATWPTRWRADRDDYRSKVSKEEWANLEKWGELAIQEVTYEMGCDINEGLTNIANALTAAATANANAMAKLSNSIVVHANAQCCDLPVGADAGVQGTVDTGDTGPIPIYGDTPLDYGREPGTFPPEFENESDYLENRCAIAHLIIDGVTSTLHGLATITVFEATAIVAVIALIAGGVIVLPLVIIAPLTAAVLAMAGFTTYFEGMKNEIESRRDEYVCILYQGETVEVIISLLADFIDSVLSVLGGAGWVKRVLKQVFLLLNNPDTLKQLYDGVAGAAYPDAVCDCCTEELFDFSSSAEGWQDWTTSGYGATQYANQRLEYTTVGYSGGSSGRVGWRKDFSPGKIVQSGDFVSMEWENLNYDNGTGWVYLQVYFTDLDTKFDYWAAQHEQQRSLMVDLSDKAGKTISHIVAYSDFANNQLTAAFDNYTEKLCGDDA